MGNCESENSSNGFNDSNTSNMSNEPRNVENSTIIISDSCIEKITTEEVPTKCSETPLDEDEWRVKLQCEDEKFSWERGITVDNIDKLLDRIEPLVGTVRALPCPSQDLMRCLGNQKHCIFRCKKYIDEYIDCIDKTRIEIIKEKIAEEERCKILEEQSRLTEQENELTNDFVKVPTGV